MNNIPSNRVTWFQLPADNVARAWTFYNKVFGWSQEAAYENVTQFGAINGEIAPRSEDLQHPKIVVRVDNISQMLEAIKDAGGKIIVRRTEIPEIGMVYASFTDTEGNLVNIVGDLK
jgi:uncharacterized protein